MKSEKDLRGFVTRPPPLCPPPLPPKQIQTRIQTQEDFYCNYKKTFVVNVNTLKHPNGKDSKLVSDIRTVQTVAEMCDF